MDSLVRAVRTFCNDIEMVFGLDKCVMLVSKNTAMVRIEGIELRDEKSTRDDASIR